MSHRPKFLICSKCKATTIKAPKGCARETTFTCRNCTPHAHTRKIHFLRRPIEESRPQNYHIPSFGPERFREIASMTFKGRCR